MNESQEYIHHLQVRVLAGLLNPNGENPVSVLSEFHRNVFPETFVEPLFSEVCRAAKDLFNRTGDCDPVVLLSEISTKQAQFRHPDARGAASIIFEATDAYNVNSVTLSRYLPILNNAALAKHLPIAQKDVESAVSRGESYEEAYAKYVTPVVERYKYKAHTRFDVSIEVDEMLKKVEGFKSLEIRHEQVIPTGFKGVDNALRGGMRPSQLIIIGARPATGKTTMALNIAANVIDDTKGKHVVFVSLEQTADQLIEKIVSLEAGCQFPKTRIELEMARQLGAIGKIEEAAKSFPFERLHVVEKTDNVDTLCSAVNELCQKHSVACVVIDYLQLIPLHGDRSRYEGITKISNKLKVLAKDANVPIVCLAQLSRNNDTEGRTPRLSDLRDSGSIEQDADVAALLYNSTNETEEEVQISSFRTVNFDIQKNRNGRISCVKMAFEPDKSKFREIRAI